MTLPEEVHALLEQLKAYMAEVCEVSLADWQDNPNSGAWVKFRLPDESHLNVYRGRNRAGRTQKFGQRYHLMLIEIADDETPVQQREQEPAPRKLSSIAGAMCENTGFRAWLEKEHGEAMPNSESAAEWIRTVCGVSSRAELDTNTHAAALFREILGEYDAARA